MNTAVIVPVLLLVGGLLLLAGRTVTAQGAVQSAANEAARAASISRNEWAAREQATATATSTLTNSGIHCAASQVTADTSAFSLPVGQSGTVRVAVTCDVPLSDIGLPGLPGVRTMTATGTSAVDVFRERE